MSTNFKDILTQVKKEIREVTVDDVEKRIESGDVVVLDVREKDEWDEGHLEGATFLPRGFLEQKIEKTVAERSTPIVVYCAGGVRSALAAKSLNQLGYSNVVSMIGGFNEWKNTGHKFVVPEKVGKDQMARYSRHL